MCTVFGSMETKGNVYTNHKRKFKRLAQWEKSVKSNAIQQQRQQHHQHQQQQLQNSYYIVFASDKSSFSFVIFLNKIQCYGSIWCYIIELDRFYWCINCHICGCKCSFIFGMVNVWVVTDVLMNWFVATVAEYRIEMLALDAVCDILWIHRFICDVNTKKVQINFVSMDLMRYKKVFKIFI